MKAAGTQALRQATNLQALNPEFMARLAIGVTRETTRETKERGIIPALYSEPDDGLASEEGIGDSAWRIVSVS